MGLSTATGAGILQYLTEVFNRKQLGRRTPATRPANAAYESLDNAYKQRVADISDGRTPMEVDLKENLPSDNFNAFNPFNSATRLASNGTNKATGNPLIDINPNVDEAYLAHELGHVASKHTDVGSFVRTLRDNPKLSKALFLAAATTPFAAAALEAGDNDMDTSMALAAASALPTLVDEGLATKNGLAMMDITGHRASMGQRGKLAAGFMSYLTPALLAGAGGNYLGNLVDQDI